MFISSELVILLCSYEKFYLGRGESLMNTDVQQNDCIILLLFPLLLFRFAKHKNMNNIEEIHVCLISGVNSYVLELNNSRNSRNYLLRYSMCQALC